MDTNLAKAFCFKPFIKALVLSLPFILVAVINQKCCLNIKWIINPSFTHNNISFSTKKRQQKTSFPLEIQQKRPIVSMSPKLRNSPHPSIKLWHLTTLCGRLSCGHRACPSRTLHRFLICLEYSIWH